MKTSPPGLFLRFFRWYCRPQLKDHIEGDLIEEYNERLKVSGKQKADRKFIIEVLLLCRPGIIRPIRGDKSITPYDMYRSYLRIGWRNVFKAKNYSLINIGGLALGLTCGILIFSLADYHLSFDNFHDDSDRIYRFVTETHRDEVDYSPSVPPAFGKAFRDDYTFGEKVARVCTLNEKLITIEGDGEIRKFKEQISFADPEFFDIFDFPLVSGARQNLLTEPNTALITERIAEKFFGNEPVIGRTFRLDSRIDFTITGVLRDIPVNTDLRSEVYFSYNTLRQYNPWYAADDSWGGITSDIQTFVRLQPGVSPADVERLLPAYVKKYRADSKNIHHYKLQPLADIHFNPVYDGKISRNIIGMLALIGVILIVVACLNFVNLLTAQAITRSREVGVRKTFGSTARQLFMQFTVETSVIVSCAATLSLFIAYFLLPYMNELFGTRATLALFPEGKLIVFLFIIVLIVTVLSSAYPGAILSRFKPVMALKGRLPLRHSGGYNLRRGMIVAQFTISHILLIGLIVGVYQVRHFRQTDMGFIKDAVVMIPVGTDAGRIDVLKTRFLQTPGVEEVSACLAAPASAEQWSGSFSFDNRSEKEDFAASFKSIDDRYLSTFGLELVAGRNLTASDTIREFLVNEKLVDKLGLDAAEDILGKNIGLNGNTWQGPVVGVVRDFHDQSFHAENQPILFASNKEYYNVFAVRTSMANVHTTLAALRKLWSETYPQNVYEHAFLDDQIAGFYKTEETIVKLIQVSSFIALFIGCTGLYGLISFMAVQKTKEIGIRKVLGGSISQILGIFVKEFSRLIVMAFFLAAPAGWILASRWLENYTYHFELSPWILVLELWIIFAIALLTIGYRSFKAAVENPVKSLRSE